MTGKLDLDGMRERAQRVIEVENSGAPGASSGLRPWAADVLRLVEEVSALLIENDMLASANVELREQRDRALDSARLNHERLARVREVLDVEEGWKIPSPLSVRRQ